MAHEYIHNTTTIIHVSSLHIFHSSGQAGFPLFPLSVTVKNLFRTIERYRETMEETRHAVVIGKYPNKTVLGELGGQSNEIVLLGIIFIKQLLLVSIYMPRSDFGFCQIFEKFFKI
jgi:hypothetical protein